MNRSAELTEQIKSLAIEAGFARVGVAPAGEVRQTDRYNRWLADGMHADMDYLALNVEKRERPDRLVGGARSAICLAVGYAPQTEPDADAIVARYARGRDYHKVLKKRCHALADRIREIAGQFEGRAFVDTAPVMERSLAARAGLGWIGRNGCLIVPGLGSYVVLCEIVCNLELEPGSPPTDGCADCGRCAEACPTGAFAADGIVDARRCVSYLTVENRGSIPEQFRADLGRRVFGCDACQEACPHNCDAPPGDPELRGDPPARFTLGEMLAWEPEDWDAATRGRTLRRATHEMFLRNAAIAAGNSGDRSLRAALEEIAQRDDISGEAAQWALARTSPAR